jgi:hypothetical protein
MKISVRGERILVLLCLGNFSLLFPYNVSGKKFFPIVMWSDKLNSNLVDR